MSDNTNNVASHELSLGQGHEFWQVLEKRGLTPKEIQGVINNPEIADGVVKTIRGFDRPSLAEAQQIMGVKHFFGPNQWYDFLGWKIKTQPIPWRKKDLAALSQTHFLFWGVKDNDGVTLSTKAWIDLMQQKKSRLSIDDQGIYFPKFVEKLTCEPKWYLMRIGPSPISTNMYLDNLLNKMDDCEFVPSLVERCLANILYYKLNNTCLDSKIWVCVNPRLPGSGDNILVRSDGQTLQFGTDNMNYNRGGMGLATSIKIPK